jgi:2-oxoisovalerate dehydrogenase E2 component (dihydrolipoyl transacylase)
VSKKTEEALAESASPEVRRLAHQLNVDLTIVTPTGADGSITAADVQRVHKVLAEIGPLQPIQGARKTMARAMAVARYDIMHSCVSDDACLAAWNKDQHTTLRLIRAIAAAVKAVPALNAWFDPIESGRRILPMIHLGITVETPEGEFVCVLQNIASRDADSLQKGLEKMRQSVADHTVPPEELRGYTLCLANMGQHGGRYTMTTVLPPTVAALAAGRVREEVVALGGKPAVARVLPLCLSFDHRAVTGGEAARFLEALVADLEKAA